MKFVHKKRELLKTMCNPDAKRKKKLWWWRIERALSKKSLWNERINEKCEALWRRQTIYNRQQILALHSPELLNDSVRKEMRKMFGLMPRHSYFWHISNDWYPPSNLLQFSFSFFISYFFWFAFHFLVLYFRFFSYLLHLFGNVFAVSFAISVFLRFHHTRPQFFSFFYLIAFLCVRFLFFSYSLLFQRPPMLLVSLCVWFAFVYAARYRCFIRLIPFDWWIAFGNTMRAA